MTDSTPDDKTPADEDATTEDTTQETATEEAADTAEGDAPEAGATAGTDAPQADATAPEADAAVAGAAVAGSADEESAEPANDEPASDEPAAKSAPRPRPKPRTTPAPAPAPSAATTVTTVVITVAVVVLVVAAVTFGILWNNSRSDLSSMDTADADRAHAEKVAGDYAEGAATVDFRNLDVWQKAMVTGVSPDLKKEIDAKSGAMSQLFEPLQWVSKGRLMDTVVASQSGPVYKVNAYVRVETSSAQASSRDVITLYTLTVDKDSDWQITDSGTAGQPASPVGDGQVPAPAPAPEAPAPAPETPAPAPAPGN